MLFYLLQLLPVRHGLLNFRIEASATPASGPNWPYKPKFLGVLRGVSHRPDVQEASIFGLEGRLGCEHQATDESHRGADTRCELHLSQTEHLPDTQEDFVVDASLFYTAKQRRVAK